MSCRGGRPCERCQADGLASSCFDEPPASHSAASMGFHAKSPSSPTMRTRGAANVSTRAKLACQGCRRDNKKVRAISAVRTGLAVFAVVAGVPSLA